MRDDTGTIKAGMAIVISSGCYSDYSFGQVYIALRDFNYMEEAKKLYMEEMEKTIKNMGIFTIMWSQKILKDI